MLKTHKKKFFFFLSISHHGSFILSLLCRSWHQKKTIFYLIFFSNNERKEFYIAFTSKEYTKHRRTKEIHSREIFQSLFTSYFHSFQLIDDIELTSTILKNVHRIAKRKIEGMLAFIICRCQINGWYIVGSIFFWWSSVLLDTIDE